MLSGAKLKCYLASVLPKRMSGFLLLLLPGLGITQPLSVHTGVGPPKEAEAGT